MRYFVSYMWATPKFEDPVITGQDRAEIMYPARIRDFKDIQTVEKMLAECHGAAFGVECMVVSWQKFDG